MPTETGWVCANCNEPLPAGERVPCPKCGDTRRTTSKIFRVDTAPVPSIKIDVVKGKAGDIISNSALIIAKSLSHTQAKSIISLDEGGKPNQIVLDPQFKAVFTSVVVITVLCIIGEVLLAIFLPSPTAVQQSVITAVDFGWKGGLGAIFGLLGGKQS